MTLKLWQVGSGFLTTLIRSHLNPPSRLVPDIHVLHLPVASVAVFVLGLRAAQELNLWKKTTTKIRLIDQTDTFAILKTPNRCFRTDTIFSIDCECVCQEVARLHTVSHVPTRFLNLLRKFLLVVPILILCCT